LGDRKGICPVKSCASFSPTVLFLIKWRKTEGTGKPVLPVKRLDAVGEMRLPL